MPLEVAANGFGFAFCRIAGSCKLSAGWPHLAMATTGD